MNILDRLIIQDKKRREIRNSRKETMHIQSKIRNTDYKIVFPLMHIPLDNKDLREGLPWLYNGFLIYLPGLVMLVDPGPNILYRLALSNINISQINTIFLSHEHLDHTGGANEICDWLIRAGQDYEVLTPSSIIEKGRLSKFHAGLENPYTDYLPPQTCTFLELKKEIKLCHGGYSLHPFHLHHGTNCYGFTLSWLNKKISYLSDTGYTKTFQTKSGVYETGSTDYQGEPIKLCEIWADLKEETKGSDYLIANTDTFRFDKNAKTHLTAYDVADIGRENKIGKIIISHINPVAELDEEWPKNIAEFVEQQTNVPTVFPRKTGLIQQI